jgi:hypothetical protein
MELLEQWSGVALGVALLVVLVQSALHEAGREPRSQAAVQDADVARRDNIRLAVLVVLVLATLGPRLFSLLI